MALTREVDEGSNSTEDFLEHAVGGIEIVIRDVLPNFFQIWVCSGWRTNVVMNDWRDGLHSCAEAWRGRLRRLWALRGRS
jgi:hypothetical protein